MRGWFATEEDWNNGVILLTDRLPNQFHARVHRRSSSDSLALAPAASTSWQPVGFSIHTSGIRWPFGLSVALDVVFGASGDGTIAHRGFQPGPLPYTTLTRVLRASTATCTSLRKPQGPQPAPYGSLGMLADFVDEWPRLFCTGPSEGKWCRSETGNRPPGLRQLRRLHA
jgi:hypothetical protein